MRAKLFQKATVFLLSTLFVLSSVLFFHQTASADSLEVVPTYQSLGIYWSPADGSALNQSTVQYRLSGSQTWSDAMSLWYDDRALGGRPAEYRGSIVSLQSGSTYDIQLSLVSGTIATVSATTWSDTPPVAQTIIVPSGRSYQVSQSGTPSGYILYVSQSGGTVLDGRNSTSVCMNVNASYVVIDGLTIKNCAQHGIKINNGNHDIIIQNNDISNWGRICTADGFGYEGDSGIYSNDSQIHNVTVQRNKIHNPRSNANNWAQSRPSTGSGGCTSGGTHPWGPHAVSFFHNNVGNNVIRYNEAWGDASHYFSDGFGGSDNFSYGGFPGRDSDVYGNILQNSWDNPLEIEGGDMNVRVWSNFTEDSFAPSIAAVSQGPLYWFRNIQNRSRHDNLKSYDSDSRGKLLKAGAGIDTGITYDGGRVYYFNNTALQQSPTGSDTLPYGVSKGLSLNEGSNGGGSATNIVSRNNILQVYKTSAKSIDATTTTDDLDNDLYNGILSAPVGNTFEQNGIVGAPTYETFDLTNYHFLLSATSLGVDTGVLLPNFTDGYVGNAPDVGAQERGGSWLQFGVHAAY